MSILAVVQIIFITLKLLGLLAWSWWWVLTPLWIGLAINAVIIAVLLAGDEL